MAENSLANVKNRAAHNQIKKLKNSSRQWIQNEGEIAEESICFYKGLLGTTTTQLPAISLEICRRGQVLSRSQQLFLIEPVTHEEIYQAPQDIDDMKAPRGDGFNALFF